MGLISRIVTLPLAPVGGVVWVADHLERAAQRVLDATAAAEARDELQRLTDAVDRGDIDEEEFERLEDQLLRRITVQPTDPDRSVES